MIGNWLIEMVSYCFPRSGVWQAREGIGGLPPSRVAGQQHYGKKHSVRRRAIAPLEQSLRMVGVVPMFGIIAIDGLDLDVRREIAGRRRHLVGCCPAASSSVAQAVDAAGRLAASDGKPLQGEPRRDTMSAVLLKEPRHVPPANFSCPGCWIASLRFRCGGV